MRKLFYRVFTIMIVGLVLSCSDEFLELTPQQSVADTDALTNLEDYKSSITGVYNELSYANYYGRYFILVPDVMADDVKQNSQANRAKQYAEYVATVSDVTARDMWTGMYRAINATNQIINADVSVPESVQDEKDHMVGEAYAVRGLIHFDLVRLFAEHYTYTSGGTHLGVPIVTQFDPTAQPTRNSVDEVYTQVIDDMTMAISLMGNSRSGDTRTLSVDAVRALLARVYLYKEDWTNAEDLASLVIDPGKYSLVPNGSYFTDLWENDDSNESLFEIAMTENDNRGSDHLGRMYLLEGYGDYLPSNDVVSLYDPADVRLSVFKTDPLLTGDYAPFRMNKYPDVNAENNIKVMRLAELYLIRAEARAELSGNDAGARADLDMVKQRGLDTAPPSTESGQALKDAIFLERRKELCFEGQRLWDLRRKQMDIVRVQCTSTTVCNIPYTGVQESEKTILPIPQMEQDANPNIEQNPGYVE
ncbi:MAG: RagB/SusD family nutrient uptake outer membrane protein [Bacteroidota bacterium]